MLASAEFIRLMGAHTAAGFGRPWREIADEFALDPDGRVAQALASHDTWAGITVNWPADGGEHLPVELAGLPVYDRERNFAGFKGFGVCRDLDGLNRLDALRRYELFAEPRTAQRLSADVVEPDPEPEAPPPPSRLRRRLSLNRRLQSKPNHPHFSSKRIHTQPIRKRQWKRLRMSCRSAHPVIPGHKVIRDRRR